MHYFLGKGSQNFKHHLGRNDKQLNATNLKLGRGAMRTFIGQKMNLPLRISSVNVAKSEGNCGFGQIY